MLSEKSRKLKGQEEGVMGTITTTTTMPSSEGEAAAVSDGYFSSPPRAPPPTGGNGYSNADLSTIDLDTTLPPPYTYTASHSLFPLPPQQQPSRASGGATTRLQIPQSPARAHTNSSATSSPMTPMSQRSVRSFATAPDLEKGGPLRLKLKLTRSATYSQLKPFFSRSGEPLDDGPRQGGAGVSARRSVLIAATVLALTIVLVMGLLFGLMKWFD